MRRSEKQIYIPNFVTSQAWERCILDTRSFHISRYAKPAFKANESRNKQNLAASSICKQYFLDYASLTVITKNLFAFKLTKTIHCTGKFLVFAFTPVKSLYAPSGQWQRAYLMFVNNSRSWGFSLRRLSTNRYTNRYAKRINRLL